MSRLIVDLESNGLLDKLTKIHCICTYDLDTGKAESFHGQTLEIGLDELRDADELIGHNLIDFDIPAIQKVYPGFQPKGKLTDTLVISRLIWANMKDLDFNPKSPVPGGKKGKHTLESWGIRLGLLKGDYAAMMKEKGLDPWAEFNDDMLEYCENDVEVTLGLWNLIGKKSYSATAIQLEHDVWRLCAEQTRYGISFDEHSAVELYGKLVQLKLKAEEELKQVFGSWEVYEEFIPKRDNKKLGYKKGVPFIKTKVIEFNPGSRHHIADRLIKLRGWKPTEFTPSGQPKVDESVISKLKYPEAKPLMRYLLLDKRISQLAEGDQAWLKKVKDGRIHGRVMTNGAVTGRATHSHPNLAQVPANRAPFGEECRALFRATPGMVLVGADASGLELRCLAHYLSHYDGGAYGDTVLNGDIHTANQEAAGLATRDQAKTFIYALLYGAGPGKIGSIVGKGAGAGKTLQKKFMANLPAFGKLMKGVKGAFRKRKCLTGLDGRLLHCRSEHSALNTLLQGAGAAIMKQAMVNYHGILERDNVPFHQVLWIHDEFQTECLPEHADAVGRAMVEGMRMTTAQFNLGCPIDGEYKVGKTWAETH